MGPRNNRKKRRVEATRATQATEANPAAIDEGSQSQASIRAPAYLLGITVRDSPPR
jgi:hypothetical protein